MTRTFMAAIAALGIAGTFITAPASAKMLSEGDAVTVPVDFVGEQHPRSIFDDIRNSAPRSVFDQLRDSAP